MRKACPGLGNYVRPKPGYIACPNCGGDVEIRMQTPDREEKRS